MRAFAVLIVLVAAGALAWTWSKSADSIAPPAASAPRDAAPVVTATPPPAVTAREAAPAETGQEDAEIAGSDKSPAVAPDEPEIPRTAETDASTQQATAIVVRSAASNLPLNTFRWSFVAGERKLSGTVEGDGAELPLPAGVTGDLLVEADGMQPERLADVTATTQPEAPLRLEVYLRPTRRAEGVTLLVHDTFRRPVADIRVDAFALSAERADKAWHLGTPMWSRTATSSDGRYELPPLAPGSYGVQVCAVDERGRPAPLAAFRGTYDLTGTNGFLEDVVLAPACALRLDLRDASGAAVDPAARGSVNIHLREPSDDGVSRRWTSANPGGGTVSDVDRLPGPSPAWVAAPVAPGSYTLEITVDGRLAVRQPLQLDGGIRVERVLLP